MDRPFDGNDCEKVCAMNLPTNIESIAVFGSVPRGDADLISDKDVLIAGSARNPVVEQALSKAGFSPSVYSWQQMESMSLEGSLFLQHLKQESQVLVDRDGRLRDLLNEFRPLVDYSHRIAQNFELFEMTTGTPECPPLIGWAFDVLSVGFRNHAILELANTGRYVFSYAALVAEASAAHRLSPTESQLLLELRLRKRDYRERCLTIKGTFKRLQQTQAVIARITGADCLSSQLSAEEFVANQIKAASANTHWYYALRRLEGAYRAMGFTPALASSALLREIESIFAKPSPYGDAGTNSIERLRIHVEAIWTTWVMQPHSRSALSFATVA